MLSSRMVFSKGSPGEMAVTGGQSKLDTSALLVRVVLPPSTSSHAVVLADVLACPVKMQILPGGLNVSEVQMYATASRDLMLVKGHAEAWISEEREPRGLTQFIR